MTFLPLLLTLGTPAQASTGGPDAFGYTWIDSDEVDGKHFIVMELVRGKTLVEYVRPGGVSKKAAKRLEKDYAALGV